MKKKATKSKPVFSGCHRFKEKNVALTRLATDHWNAIRFDKKIMLDYLRQGICFEISRTFYEYLKEETRNDPTQKMHAYVGIEKSRLVLFCILRSEDLKLAKDPDLETAPIFVAPCISEKTTADKGFLTFFPPGPETDQERMPISLVRAWQRLARWGLCNPLFLDQQIEQAGENKDESGVFRVFDVEISSIIDEFEGRAVSSILVFPGLKAETDPQTNETVVKADLIFWGETAPSSGNGVPGTFVSDFTSPRPPFGGDLPLKNYGLF